MTELNIGEAAGFCEHGDETSNCKSDFFSSRETNRLRKTTPVQWKVFGDLAAYFN